MKKKLFIALEGIDGSGKSTQQSLLAGKLREAGIRVHTTSEPTDSRIGRLIREIFQHKLDADHKTIAALFVADRLDHLLNKTNGMLKKWEEGFSIIADRYYFSSYAYHGTHMDLDWVINANSLSAELLRPDLNIFIDIQPETAMHRLGKRKSSAELYETGENLRKVREKYFEAFDKLRDKERIFITKGDRAPEQIAADIWAEVAQSIDLENRFNGKAITSPNEGKDNR
jgi:dTMP kinase